MKTISRALLIILFTTTAAFAQTKANDHGWPRKFAIGNNNVAVYQPQIEEWTGNSFAARAAMAITQSSSKQPLYGVLWFTARAEVDKPNRLVTTGIDRAVGPSDRDRRGLPAGPADGARRVWETVPVRDHLVTAVVGLSPANGCGGWTRGASES